MDDERRSQLVPLLQSFRSTAFAADVPLIISPGASNAALRMFVLLRCTQPWYRTLLNALLFGREGVGRVPSVVK